MTKDTSKSRSYITNFPISLRTHSRNSLLIISGVSPPSQQHKYRNTEDSKNIETVDNNIRDIKKYSVGTIKP
jgi:hypothetical protein